MPETHSANSATYEERLREGRALVEEMDRRMPEQATEDEDGFITSYRIPVGPWHRLLAWARKPAAASAHFCEGVQWLAGVLREIEEVTREEPDPVEAATRANGLALKALGEL